MRSALIPELAAYGLADQMRVTFQPPASLIASAGFGVVVSAEDVFGGLDTSFSGTATLSNAQLNFRRQQLQPRHRQFQ